MSGGRSWPALALGVVLVVAAVLPVARAEGPAGDAGTVPPSAPVGFSVTPVTAVPTPTSLDFSPDGETLYVTSFSGNAYAYPVVEGTTLGAPREFLSDLEKPLGVLATGHGVFISDEEPADEEGGRPTGKVIRVQDDGDGGAHDLETVVAGLPVGRHNTNGMALGPDGALYVTNGNSTDSGFGREGGDPEVPPYSGSLLRIDPTATGLSPEPRMVVGTGWRNPYDVAFVPEGHPAAVTGQHRAVVPMNGPDGIEYCDEDGDCVTRPTGEDTLSTLRVNDGEVEHFGFPWCLYDRDRGGLDGFAQDPDEGPCPPTDDRMSRGFPEGRQVTFARPAALFGTHVSADGLAFNPGTDFPSTYDDDLFVAEFGNFFGDDVVGHKVVRVTFDSTTGAIDGVEDFLTGLFPLDLTFAPDGAMWVADFGGVIYRVSSIVPR